MIKNEVAQYALLIESLVSRYVAESVDNNLGPPFDEKIFDSPLVGFSQGSDPLYDEYKNHIGADYFSPLELFQKTFPEVAAAKKDLTVISWILPSTAKTRDEQTGMTKQPSRRWAHTRAVGEDFNNQLRRHLLEYLGTENILALAPLLSPFWQKSDVGPYAPRSNWSERHAAYTAGLGTFGLCDALITPVGKAVRIGSVIAMIDITPTPRPYIDHHDYCLYHRNGTCGVCIDRCPVGALSDKGHDKNRCMQYTERSMNQYIQKKFDLDTYACGLCQAGVPCMSGIPADESI